MRNKLELSRWAQLHGSHTIWGHLKRLVREREPSTLRDPLRPRCRSAPPVRDPLAGSNGATGRGAHGDTGCVDGPAVWQQPLGFSGGHSALGHPTYGTSPLKSLISKPRAQHSPRPLPPPAAAHTAGPPIRWPDRTERRGGGGGRHEMWDGPAVWQSGLSFPGGHSSVRHTPYGTTPLKSLVAPYRPNAISPNPPSPHPPQRAPPVRDPLAGSHGATGRGAWGATRDA